MLHEKNIYSVTRKELQHHTILITNKHGNMSKMRNTFSFDSIFTSFIVYILKEQNYQINIVPFKNQKKLINFREKLSLSPIPPSLASALIACFKISMSTFKKENCFIQLSWLSWLVLPEVTIYPRRPDF